MLHENGHTDMDTQEDTWQFLKNTDETCVQHTCRTGFGHDTAP